MAHLGYFRRDLIVGRHWMNERSYAELIGLCQFLPGPSSSQVGIGIGLAKGGWPGAVATWIGFTLPSAILMAALGRGFRHLGSAVPQWLTHGLILVAAPIVAQAVWLMARQLCPDWPRRLLATAAVLVLNSAQLAIAQPLVILAGGVIGSFAFANHAILAPGAVP